MAFACFVCSMYTKISFQSPLLGICMYLSGPTKWTNIRSAHTIYVSNFKKFYEYKVGIHIYACTVYTLHTIHPIALLTSSVSFSLFFPFQLIWIVQYSWILKIFGFYHHLQMVIVYILDFLWPFCIFMLGFLSFWKSFCVLLCFVLYFLPFFLDK